MGVGRQAAGRELRGRRARPRLRATRAARDRRWRRVRAYREAMRRFAAMRTLDVWYARARRRAQLAAGAESAAAAAQQRKRVDRARRQGAAQGQHARVREAHARRSTATPRIVSDPPLIVPLDELAARGEAREVDETRIARADRAYRAHAAGRPPRACSTRYRFVDVARKVVGVGSVGTRAWIVLLLGRDDARPAVPPGQGGAARRCSSPTPAPASRQPGPARRRGPAADAGGQRHPPRLDARSTGLDGAARDFYVRQLWDWKGSADVEAMDAAALALYAQLCGWTLARAHARSRRPRRDRRLPRRAATLRPRDRRLRRGLRRPERARPRGARRRRRGGDDRRGSGSLAHFGSVTACPSRPGRAGCRACAGSSGRMSTDRSGYAESREPTSAAREHDRDLLHRALRAAVVAGHAVARVVAQQPDDVGRVRRRHRVDDLLPVREPVHELAEPTSPRGSPSRAGSGGRRAGTSRSRRAASPSRPRRCAWRRRTCRSATCGSPSPGT